MSGVGASWDETEQQVLEPFKSHSTWETAHLYLMETAAGVKLNYDFSDLKYKHGPVVPRRSLKVGVTLMPQHLHHYTSILLWGRWSCQMAGIVLWSRKWLRGSYDPVSIELSCPLPAQHHRHGGAGAAVGVSLEVNANVASCANKPPQKKAKLNIWCNMWNENSL